MTKSTKVKFYSYEPAAFPADHDWLIMTAEERGCFHSLIIFIACADGSLPFNERKLAALCNLSGKKFAKFWDQFGKKFLLKDGLLSHKRVSAEISKARKSIRQKRIAGIASGKARSTAAQRLFNTPPTIGTGTESESESEGIGSNTYVTDGNSLKFYDLCVQLFNLRSNSDRTCFRKIAAYLQTLAQENYDDPFTEAYGMAQAARRAGKNPVALFISKMKTDMGYRVK